MNKYDQAQRFLRDMVTWLEAAYARDGAKAIAAMDRGELGILGIRWTQECDAICQREACGQPNATDAERLAYLKPGMALVGKAMERSVKRELRLDLEM